MPAPSLLPEGEDTGCLSITKGTLSFSQPVLPVPAGPVLSLPSSPPILLLGTSPPAPVHQSSFRIAGLHRFQDTFFSPARYKQAGKMLSVSSLLNPSPPGPLPPPPRFLPSPAMSSPGSCYADRAPSPYPDQRPAIPKLKMAKDHPAPMSKYKPRGVIKYFPFEDVDETARREVLRFRVAPFGRIQESCAHIPYNSGKKDFFEKTGRESFEGAYLRRRGGVFSDGLLQFSSTSSRSPERTASSSSCGTTTSASFA